MEIVNQANSVQFSFSATEKVTLPKDSISLSLRNGIVYVSGDSKSRGFRGFIEINYEDVTSPTVSSAADLFTVLNGYSAGKYIVEGTVNITSTGVQDVILSSAMPSDSYVVVIYDVNGIGVSLTGDQTATTFEINALTQPGDINYIAVST